MDEIWKDIEGYDKYLISNLGRVRSLKQSSDNFLKIHYGKSKPLVNLVTKGKGSIHYVDTLVAQAFLGYNKDKRKEIIIWHIDNDKLNCNVNNLELISMKEYTKRRSIIRCGHRIENNSKEYRRISYICKREKISRTEYFSNPEKYSVSRRRTKHLDYEYDTPDYYKTIRLKRLYGLTLDECNKMLIEQENKCAICGRSGTIIYNGKDKNDLLYIDHDHETGKVRGILCCNCNFGLSLFRDDPELLKSAIAYINYHKNKNNI